MINLNKYPKTLKEVNKHLPKGYELIKGKGYLYFWGNDCASWYTSSVAVCYLKHLTIKRWIEEFNYLKSKEANND